MTVIEATMIFVIVLCLGSAIWLLAGIGIDHVREKGER